MRYKAVLFDLDGTLLDTIEDLANSMNAVLHGLDLPEHPIADYKYFVGEGVEELVRRALPEDQRGEVLLREGVAALRREYGKRWAEQTHPYAGIPALLDALTARAVPMAILSNKPHDFTQLIVSRLLPTWPFALVMGAQPSMPKKPDPTAALQMAAQLALSPPEIIYLGDTGTDMMTASAAGMYSVGALWGFRTEAELRATGAKTLLENPLDLLLLLD